MAYLSYLLSLRVLETKNSNTRRSDQCLRRGERVFRPGGVGTRHSWQNGDNHRPQAQHDQERRQDRGARRRTGGGDWLLRRADELGERSLQEISEAPNVHVEKKQWRKESASGRRPLADSLECSLLFTCVSLNVSYVHICYF